MFTALLRTAPEDRKDPPKRLLYLSLVTLSPCMALATLWNQGDLTIVTSSITLSAAGVFYLNLEKIQNYLRPAWTREYEAKLARWEAHLMQRDLSAIERQQILVRIQDLNDRYHLVTNPTLTYRWVKGMAISMGFIAKALRMNNH